jgi:hypothetical protein
MAEEEAGRVVLGGCVVEEESPTWACKGPDQHGWVPEVASMQVADLLHEALRVGDDQGLTQIRGRHLPDGLVAALANAGRMAPSPRARPAVVTAARR